MSKLEGIPQVIEFDPFSQEASAAHNLGEAVYLADARIFRYGKSALGSTKGHLQTAPAHDTALDNLTVTAAVVHGGTEISITPGATTAVAGAFDEGYMIVNDNDGEGQTYKIRHNPAIASTTTFILSLFDPINVALTTSSQVSLFHNTYSNVIEATSVTAQPAGVPLVTLASGYYGWLQTHGVASVLCGTTGTLGALGMAAATGAVTDMTDVTAPETEYWVGRFVVAGVSTEYRPFFLTID